MQDRGWCSWSRPVVHAAACQPDSWWPTLHWFTGRGHVSICGNSKFTSGGARGVPEGRPGPAGELSCLRIPRCHPPPSPGSSQGWRIHLQQLTSRWCRQSIKQRKKEGRKKRRGTKLGKSWLSKPSSSQASASASLCVAALWGICGTKHTHMAEALLGAVTG